MLDCLHTASRRAAVLLVVGAAAAAGCSGGQGAAATEADDGERAGSECLDEDVRGCFDGDPDKAFVGACRRGTQTCQADDRWGPCEGQVLPAEELCDGVDNNCDGQTDEGCATDRSVSDQQIATDQGLDLPVVTPDAGVSDAPVGCPVGTACDDKDPCTVGDVCGAGGVCAGQVASGFHLVLQLDKSQTGPNDTWAERKTATVNSSSATITGVRVSGRVEGAGYCYAYWGSGRTVAYRSQGDDGVYNLDNHDYNGCPTDPPSFSNDGKIKICQKPDSKASDLSRGGASATGLALPPKTKVIVETRHVVPNKGGWIKCKLELECS